MLKITDQAYVFGSELILAMRKGGTRRAASAGQVSVHATDASPKGASSAS